MTEIEILETRKQGENIQVVVRVPGEPEDTIANIAMPAKIFSVAELEKQIAEMLAPHVEDPPEEEKPHKEIIGMIYNSETGKLEEKKDEK